CPFFSERPLELPQLYLFLGERLRPRGEGLLGRLDLSPLLGDSLLPLGKSGGASLEARRLCLQRPCEVVEPGPLLGERPLALHQLRFLLGQRLCTCVERPLSLLQLGSLLREALLPLGQDCGLPLEALR